MTDDDITTEMLDEAGGWTLWPDQIDFIEIEWAPDEVDEAQA